MKESNMPHPENANTKATLCIIIYPKEIEDKISECKQSIEACYAPLNLIYNSIKQLSNRAKSYPVDSEEYRAIEQQLLLAKDQLAKMAHQCTIEADKKGLLNELKELAAFVKK